MSTYQVNNRKNDFITALTVATAALGTTRTARANDYWPASANGAWTTNSDRSLGYFSGSGATGADNTYLINGYFLGDLHHA